MNSNESDDNNADISDAAAPKTDISADQVEHIEAELHSTAV